MRPGESFVGQPIRSLQTMLRVIAQTEEAQPSLIPDGIYGPQTISAVAAFQRSRGLPITGITDQETWEAVVAAYEPALILVDEAEPIAVVFEPNEVITAGQRHPNVYLAQGMLMVLSQVYGSISPPGMSGVLDIPTGESLSSFQRLSALPDTGQLDRITWKRLALHYPAAANLALQKK
ncbi:MAG: peptidoglycan-binding protein [Oscillospiraceae bacterium]|nr:peptidoglycan-binding protein [Oscillospiraceae bacterium]